MTELCVRPAGSPGPGWRVWPDAQPIPPGAIAEANDYFFELSGAEGAPDADLFIDDLALEALRTRNASSARWRWSPGFHAGTAECRLRLAGRSHTFDVILDPAERKLTRDAFDTMVREILEDSFALFSLSSFHKGLSRGNGHKPPPLARLQFLRSRIGEIARTVEAIAASPRKLLRGEDVALPFHRAAGATGAEILKSFRSGRVLVAQHSARLPPGLAGHLPAQILKRTRRSTFDRLEHREIKASLRLWSAWLTGAAVLLASAPGDGEVAQTASTWSRRLRRLAHTLDKLLRLPLFADVGTAPPRVTASAIWRADPRYRRFHQLWRDMSLGITNLFGDFLDMPLARTFDLYELWCFLRLLRVAAARNTGPPLELGSLFLADAAGLTLAAGAVTVPLPGLGLTLCFQRRYREFWREQEGVGSFSRDMQPDIVFERRDAAADQPLRLIVIDAKYRIGPGLNDALGSAHMYRDAIVHGAAGGIKGTVDAAYLVTPDAPLVAGPWRDTRLPARLFHPDYRRTFRFGAVTLQPGMPMTVIEAAFDAMTEDATIRRSD
ncbi:DUF2357 domain-containing protein [Sphingomonas sp. MAH-20]|uniref:DUF2357 domain-containing protein n=1 Tax=Sphingomonas horti TaxID=2682842 RepID=A0A6I4J0H8_9SPHN|nr:MULTISPECIES: DUF2357 domain-containing protein [Sphingomonas]MBA2920637.1 DUF2357 domain-containing protein [Sphingomonas sp. CGMCC 1.13658]MVO77573.1 DUF2357 domain-containing protein [Sphingomonas horti]